MLGSRYLLVGDQSEHKSFFLYQSRGVGVNEAQFTRQYREGVSGFIQILKSHPEIPRLFSKQLLYKLKGAGNTNFLSVVS